MFDAHRRCRKPPSKRSKHSRRPALEPLESRALLVVAGVGYVLSGNQWSNPAQITFSFAPDGVWWDHGVNDLQAVMDARFGPGVWERELARALQTWASVANLNFTQVADTPLPENAPGQAQGDPRFGDIRIGGYAFADPNTLAVTYFPPPNGQTSAGDSEINTSANWHIGSNIDLYSAMLHEFGHSLGLDHALDPAAVMYGVYQGVRSGLSVDDVAGIQAIYGPRIPDGYQSRGQGVSFATAIDLSGALNASYAATLSGVELAAVGDMEFFSLTVPPGAGGSLDVVAHAAGISLLSPRVSVFDASGNLLATQAQPAAYGDDVQVAVPGAAPGQTYFITVSGATSDVFAAGAYQLELALGSAAPTGPPGGPPIAPPTATVSLPVLPDRLEPNNAFATATPLGAIFQVSVPGLTLDTASDQDDFSFQTARPGWYQASAQGTLLKLYTTRGRLVRQGLQSLAFRAPGRAGRFFLVVSAPTPAPVPSYTLSIAHLPVLPFRSSGPHGQHAAHMEG